MCELKDSWLQEAASLNKHKVSSTAVQTAMLNRLLATTNGFISTGCLSNHCHLAHISVTIRFTCCVAIEWLPNFKPYSANVEKMLSS